MRARKRHLSLPARSRRLHAPIDRREARLSRRSIGKRFQSNGRPGETDERQQQQCRLQRTEARRSWPARLPTRDRRCLKRRSPLLDLRPRVLVRPRRRRSVDDVGARQLPDPDRPHPDRAAQRVRRGRPSFINVVLILAMIAHHCLAGLGLLAGLERQGAGARLHIRIVALFCLIAALPAMLLAVAATTTFSRSLDGWFSAARAPSSKTRSTSRKPTSTSTARSSAPTSSTWSATSTRR